MLRFLFLVSVVSSAVAMAQVLAPKSAADVSAQFLALMVADKPNEAVVLFSEAIQAQKPGPAIVKAWTQHVAGLGALKQTVELKGGPSGDKQVFVRRLEFERGAILTYVTVNSTTLRLEGFQLKPAPKDFVSAAYVTPASFRAEELSFGAKDFVLPATVLIPSGKGPFPAVVLVHGSGPNDRDESIGGNKPFRDLAEGLASRGVLVFRYDKRTLVHGAKMTHPTIDTEVVDDAVAAIALLRQRPDVDGKRVVVLGHSLGALLAPQIAKSAKANGAVLLAPPARSPWQILPQQHRYLGVPEAEVAAMEQKLFAIRDGQSHEPVMGAPAAYWRDWASRDALAIAKTLEVPLLVMWGDRDYQVIAEDFAAWKKGLAGRKRVKLVEVPGANHLFIAGTGKPGPAEYEVAGHVMPDVVAAVAAFVSAASAP
jgi:dienelactone hydrolase